MYRVGSFGLRQTRPAEEPIKIIKVETSSDEILENNEKKEIPNKEEANVENNPVVPDSSSPKEENVEQNINEKQKN